MNYSPDPIFFAFWGLFKKKRQKKLEVLKKLLIFAKINGFTNQTNIIFMKKKFICAVCGYIYEGDAAPEKCPICKAPASKFSELKDEGETTYATVHRIGDGKPEGVSQEMIDDLRNHFNGECGEVGMYLAMSRQADREGYPEIAEVVLARISSALPRTPRLLVSTLFTTPFTRWLRTRPVTEQALLDC